MSVHFTMGNIEAATSQSSTPSVPAQSMTKRRRSPAFSAIPVRVGKAKDVTSLVSSS